ncbi:hypothetical protein PRZ48_009891 [Zasmidium cellare]|uniref:Glycosyltransferase 2-like domain-containing protein n=1 Tax=Zasmidium cellare TaxID=395010 RepID=A0ABR0ED23_ZASCE|nr:hypothetical protein PRZ48_009891 [Zasmidium cellare]
MLDFRPTTVGITMLLLAATFMALADLFASSGEECLTGESESTSTLGTTDILGALALALFWCHFREQQFFDVRPYSPWASDLPTLGLNLVSSTLAFSTAGHVFRYPLPTQEQSIIRLALPISLNSLVTVPNSWSSEIPPLISPWQLIGFTIVVMALSTVESRRDHTNGCFDSDDVLIGIQCQVCRSEDTAATNVDRHGIASNLSLLLPLLLLVSSVVLAKAITVEFAQNTSASAILDKTFQPTRSLDIIIARYDESASEMARHLNELHSLAAIQSLEPRIIVYDKSEEFNSSTLLSELSRLVDPWVADIAVFHLKNVGRETDTYLEHITSHWDDLAAHTLFMQASPHHAPRAYLRRIRDYFVPETGFLSLADSKGFCSSCDECHDRDWSENPSVLSSIFDDFNHGAPCADMVLTYRGQFIAATGWLYAGAHVGDDDAVQWERDRDSVSNVAE